MLVSQIDVPIDDRTFNTTARNEQSTAKTIELVLSAQQHERPANDRRKTKRHPYPYPIRITPLVDGNALAEESFVVIGRHMTTRGLDFYHQETFSYRHVIASLPVANGLNVDVLLGLSWCRFGDDGWYASGGRWIRTLPPSNDLP